MTEKLVLIFKSLVATLLLGSLPVFANKADLEPLIANVNIWDADFDNYSEKFSYLEWKEITPYKTGFLVESDPTKEMIFWGQPVYQVKLNLSQDKKLIQSLHFVVSDQKLNQMADDEFSKVVIRWKNLVSKKLSKESKSMPKMQIGDDYYSRLAWDGPQSIVVLAVIENNGSKRIELIYRERKYGMAMLRRSGKQPELEFNDEPSPAGETRKLTAQEKSIMGLASKASLQKALSIEDNFDAEWPKLVKTSSPDIMIIKEDDEAGEFIYHSPNYEFISDVKLSQNVIKNFSTLFEATRLYCQQMPLSLVKAHIPDGEMKFKILLFGNRQDYLKNGGPQSSAGVYYPNTGTILVPLSSLGVKKVGSGFMFDYKSSNKALPHEITHQLTNTEYLSAGARGWFSEGLAEYVAMTAYRSGKFMVNANLKDIRASVTEGSKKDGKGRYLGDEFTAPDLKNFMMMDYKEFVINANLNYGLGALLTYYFLHMDGEGERKRINAFLVSLNEGKKGEEAIKMLLDGRSYDELEADIAKAWRARGVKINFK